MPTATLGCFELIVSRFNDLGLEVEFSHGFEVNEVSVCVVLKVLPPRLLQDHSPSREPHCTVLVQHRKRSGVLQVNSSDHSA